MCHKISRAKISELDDATIFEYVNGAANAYICPTGAKNSHVIAIFSDVLRASIFVSDYRILHENQNAFLLNELPLSVQIHNLQPLLIERGEMIHNWLTTGGVLATTPGALMSPCAFGSSEMKLQLDQEISPEKLSAWLHESGYTNSSLVWSPGQYVRRGFIIDVFDPAHAMPIRIEFFDDVIDRIGAFNPQTQKSDATLMKLDEIILHGLSSKNDSRKFPIEIFPANAKILFFDTDKINIQAGSFRWLWEEILSENHAIYKIQEWNEILAALLDMKNLRIEPVSRNAKFEADISPLPAFKGDASVLSGICDALEKRNFQIRLYTQNPIFFETPYELHREKLSSGFIDNSGKIAFISDRELSGIIANEPVTKWRAPLDWQEKLSVGQLVIHEDFGVGIFRGIEKFKAASSDHEPVDRLAIEFADEQRLLIPVLQSYKLTPLNEHANEDTKLDSLRSVRWKKNLAKIREQAHDEAKTLLEIFAHRELERREPRISPDDMYDKFVSAFPFNETLDQLKAIEDIMRDLSSNFPMDRLLVGDVGFGKTEVAMRAAFRVIESGFQVCVLVPTTLLAQQHFNTFQSRFAGFPVKIGMLSRFVSSKQSAKIISEIRENKLDIIIATHKILQKGIDFKNLGLLIIDEEHRFGVMHKEGWKKIYGSVDVLSLSATPIPRTLALSLRGLRSVSILLTPPENRLPVATFSGIWQGSTVRRAVAYELARGGQVYFLSCRISRIERYRQMLEALFPDAKIGIAHGQLSEKELEQIMLKFYAGEIDILISTTIIESGLDVGRANTIIIDNSEELGLAQMYQLRGRVGRRGEKAFAYFFYPERGILNRETMDRLEAITTMTDLGSGYEIAKRDLDIRGGGNIGGTSQHGKEASGNFGLFYEMLERELENLRGLKHNEPVQINSDHGVGSIPEYYIPQEDVRVTLYRRLMQASDLPELDNLLSEMRDRFGKLPDDVKYLGGLLAIRKFGSNFGIKRVEIKNGLVKISCPNEFGITTEKSFARLPENVREHVSNLGRRIIFAQ